MEKYQEFKELMEEYDSLLDKLTKVENSKVIVISQDRVEELESLMRTEEAEILRMRGLDRKRKRLLEETGHGGKTFSQVVDSLEGEEYDTLKDMCVKMREKTESLRGLSGSTANMLEAKLINIDEVIRRNNLPAGTGYDQKGVLTGSGTGAVSRIKPVSV